jgi:hypothetical protein
VAIIPPDDEQAGHHWLLVRRRLSDGELAFYRCWSPTPVALPTLVRVAGGLHAITRNGGRVLFIQHIGYPFRSSRSCSRNSLTLALSL